MAYADYNDYRDSYGGTSIGEGEFGRYADRAGEYLELLTYGRCSGELDAGQGLAVRLACCAAADELHRQDTEPELVQHSIGQWSRSYAPHKDSSRRLADRIRLQLRGTGLLWRGWCYAGGMG